MESAWARGRQARARVVRTRRRASGRAARAAAPGGARRSPHAAHARAGGPAPVTKLKTQLKRWRGPRVSGVARQSRSPSARDRRMHYRLRRCAVRERREEPRKQLSVCSASARPARSSSATRSARASGARPATCARDARRRAPLIAGGRTCPSRVPDSASRPVANN